MGKEKVGVVGLDLGDGMAEMTEFKEAMQKLASDIVIVEDSQTANACGFYEYCKVLMADD